MNLFSAGLSPTRSAAASLRTIATRSSWSLAKSAITWHSLPEMGTCSICTLRCSVPSTSSTSALAPTEVVNRRSDAIPGAPMTSPVSAATCPSFQVATVSTPLEMNGMPIFPDHPANGPPRLWGAADRGHWRQRPRTLLPRPHQRRRRADQVRESYHTRVTPYASKTPSALTSVSPSTSLGGEHPVERVAVVVWQRLHPADVPQVDRKKRDAERGQSIRDHLLHRQRQPQLPEADLQRHLPRAGEAPEQYLLRRGQQHPGPRAE